jgi:hypothetical protein
LARGRTPVEVSYTTTLDDYVALSLHVMKRSPSMRSRFWLGWTLLTLAFLIGAAFLVTINPVGAAVLSVLAVAYAISYPFVHRAWVASAVRAYAEDLGTRGVIGRITLILTDETLTERTASVESVARWRDMVGVEVVGDCTYIYVTGLLAAIIPRHGFEREEDYEAVRDFVLAKLRKPAEPHTAPNPAR